MKGRILCVDDEQAVLQGFMRNLRKHFTVTAACGGREGLSAIAKASEPFEVVLTDMRMPGMDGLDFLAAVKQRSAKSVRMMLTGNADLQTAIEAVNTGQVFRFLTKPCPVEVLARALDDGVRQYRLLQAERELLERTLTGSVRLLHEIIEMASGDEDGLVSRHRRLVRALCKRLEIEDAWQVEMAAMLCEVGRFTIPAAVLDKQRRGTVLDREEQDLVARIPQISSQLIGNIPRLEPLLPIVAQCGTDFDRDGPEIPIGARILHVLRDFAALDARGFDQAAALQHLRRHADWYDPAVVDALADELNGGAHESQGMVAIREAAVRDLKPGCEPLQDIVTTDGRVLVAAGRRLNAALLERVRNFAAVVGIKEPIRVRDQGG